MSAGDLVQYWYFHLPNFVLAALTYTVIGRFLLGLVAPQDWRNYIWRAFCRLTDPLVAVVRAITPAVLGHRPVLLFTALWLMLLRLLFFALLASLGLAPKITG